MTVVKTREDYAQIDAAGWTRDLVKHVARERRMFDKDLIKRRVCHMTSTMAEVINSSQITLNVWARTIH